MYAFKIRARDGHAKVADGAGGEDDGVVVLLQLSHGDIAADGDVGQQSNLFAIEHTVQRVDDSLNARVVWGHAVADEAEWCWHLLDEIDLNVAAGLLNQDIGGVNAGRAGTNDGYFQGLLGHGWPFGVLC